MKKIFLAILFFATVLAPACAKQFVNITPLPKQMEVGEGVYKLPKSYTVGAALLADSLKVEAQRFVGVIGETTGCQGKFTKSKNSRENI